MTGRCRFCGCTDENGCELGCWWLDRDHTLCSACDDIARAWQLMRRAKRPNMCRAFARGYEAGLEEGLVSPPICPYNPLGETATYWQAGFDSARKAVAA